MLQNNKKTVFTVLGLVFAAIAFYWALQNTSVLATWLGFALHVLSPITLGLCMAFLLNLPMRWFEKHLWPRAKKPIAQKLRRPVSILAAVTIIVTIVSFVGMMVVPELINTLAILGKTVPVFAEQAQAWLMANAEEYPQLRTWVGSLQIDWAETGKTLLSYVTSGAGSLLGNTFSFVGALMGGVVNFVVAFILALYLLIDKEHLLAQAATLLRAVLPKKTCDRTFYVASLTNSVFASFVAGQVIEACILGALCWLCMSLFGFPYVPMIASLVGMMQLVPIVGATISLVTGAFMILMVNPMQAVWFVIFLLVLQQIEGNIIYPRVVGTSVGLPPMWVLIAVVTGGSLFGAPGFLLGVPVMSVFYTLVREFTLARTAQLQQEQTHGEE